MQCTVVQFQTKLIIQPLIPKIKLLNTFSLKIKYVKCYELLKAREGTEIFSTTVPILGT